MPGSATPYATSDDLLLLHDVRQVIDVVSDQLIRPQPALSDVTGGAARISEALASASGQLEAAAMRGGRYTLLDLTNLTGNGAALARMIVIDLAFYRLVHRRAPSVAPEAIPGAKDALELLAQLGDGTRIFPTAGAVTAVGVETASSEIPIQSRATTRAGRYFGRRYA